jgi:transcriptional regulator with XRE-family HTH domain
MDPNTQRILEKLHDRMTAQHVTQRELAQRLAALTGDHSWTQQKVWRILHGQADLTIETLAAWCRVLHVTLIGFIVDALVPPPPDHYESAPAVRPALRVRPPAP